MFAASLKVALMAGVYAAGDACTIAWTDKSPHWFQMRVWTQASAVGISCSYKPASNHGVSQNQLQMHFPAALLSATHSVKCRACLPNFNQQQMPCGLCLGANMLLQV